MWGRYDLPQSWTRLGSPNQYFLQGTRPRSDANATLRPKRNKAAPVGQQKTASRIPIPPGPSPALTICVYPPSVRVASRQYRNIRCIPRDPQIPWIKPSGGSGFPPTPSLGIRLLCLGHSHLLPVFDVGSGKGPFLGGAPSPHPHWKSGPTTLSLDPPETPYTGEWGWQMLTWTLPALRKSLAVGNGTLKYAKIGLIHARQSVMHDSEKWHLPIQPVLHQSHFDPPPKWLVEGRNTGTLTLTSHMNH